MNPFIADEEENIQKMLLIQSRGNVVDQFARIIQHHVRMISADGEWLDPGLMNRSGVISRQPIKKSAIRHDGTVPSIVKYKADLITSYNWTGHIMASLWKVYTSRDRTIARDGA